MMAGGAENILQRDDATLPDARADHAALFAQLLSGSRWALVGRCGAVAALMLMNALLTRILGPEEVGAFFLIFSVVVVAASLSQLGLPVAIVNLVGDAVGRHRWGRARAAIRATLWSASGAIAAASLLMLALGPALGRHIFHSEMVSAAMTIAAAWLAVRGIQTLLAEVFRALKDLRAATIHSGLLSTIVAVLAFAVIWRTAGQISLAEALWVSIASSVVDVILSAAILRSRLARLEHDSSSTTISEIMRTAWPLWGALIVWTLGRENDVWVLGMFRPPQEVALYGAAVRLAALASMPLMVVNAVVPPFIAELHGRHQLSELELMLRATASAALVPTLCVLACFMFEGRHALAALYGPFYASANGVLLIAGFSAFTDVATGACGLALMMTGRGNQVLLISLAGSLLALAIKLILVRRLGGVGVAAGAAIGFTAQNLAMLLVAKRDLGIWTSVLSITDSAFAARLFLAGLRQPQES
jgi:O-antigen/teichoic acid export membrane protein